MSERVKFTIIGAGVIGCAIAYELSKKYEEIFVLEKNAKITGENQSSRNSGVIHSGIYYPKDEAPQKGKFCREGNGLLYDFCREFDVPHRRTGKLVVAVDERELEYLQDTVKIALENCVPGIKMLSGDEARGMEPNVKCWQAAYFPTSGIIEPTQLVHKLYTLASQQGVYFLTGNEVKAIKRGNRVFLIAAQAGGRIETFESEVVINSAGVYSDEIARMINRDCPFEIVPIRGELAKFYKSRRKDTDHAGLNVYPVPHAIYEDGSKAVISFAAFQKLYKEKKVLKTTGAHLTPTFDLMEGRYEIGNTVTVGPATKGGIAKDDLSSDLLPPEHFWNLVQPFFPSLKVDDLSPHQTGVQAKLKDHHDYVIEPDPRYNNFIQLIGIDSPGLTSCLAIARHVRDLIAAIRS